MTHIALREKFKEKLPQLDLPIAVVYEEIEGLITSEISVRDLGLMNFMGFIWDLRGIMSDLWDLSRIYSKRDCFQ